ncbi:GDSL esterase/lipase-like protein [Drosera capensis]
MHPSSIVHIFSIVSWCLLLIFQNVRRSNALILPDNVTAPSAVFIFGDSIVDAGNNNHFLTTCRSNFPPYGRIFPGGVATGRFSDGMLPSDFFAQEFGVKTIVPAYLDPSLTIDDMLTGVNFASAFLGFISETSTYKYPALSLDLQLELFREYIIKVKAAVGEQRTSDIISQSVYFLCTGSNDFIMFYDTKKYTNTSAYTDSIVSYASGFLNKLYSMGARTVAVGSAPPSGCLPWPRTERGGFFRTCVQDINQLSIDFNLKLQSMMTALQPQLQGSKLVYLDIYYQLLDVIQNPHEYGFEVSDRGCCGTGLFEEGPLCNIFSMPYSCKNSSAYVFWDGSHPSQATYQICVQRLLNKTKSQFFP